MAPHLWSIDHIGIGVGSGIWSIYHIGCNRLQNILAQGRVHAGCLSSRFGVGGQSYSNFLASTGIWPKSHASFGP